MKTKPERDVLRTSHPERLYHGEVVSLFWEALDALDEKDAEIERLKAELNEHKIRLAFAGREIAFGVGSDGKPSQATQRIAKLEAALEKADKAVVLAGWVGGPDAIAAYDQARAATRDEDRSHVDKSQLIKATPLVARDEKSAARCDECDPLFGCFDGSKTCCRVPAKGADPKGLSDGHFKSLQTYRLALKLEPHSRTREQAWRSALHAFGEEMLDEIIRLKDARAQALAEVCEWLRTPQPGTLCEDQERDNRLADVIERKFGGTREEK